MFDNRQTATLIILALSTVLLIIYSLTTKGDVHKSFTNAIKKILDFKLLSIFALYGIWIIAIHWLAWKIGLWETSLVGQSLFWSGAAIYLLFSVTDASKKAKFFRNKVVDTIKLGVLFEFFINIKPLSLWLELILQPIIALLVLRQVSTERTGERTFAHVFLGLIGLGLTVYTIHWAATSWDQIDKVLELQKLLMPVWLTMGALPFIYAIAAISGYQTIFALMKKRSKGKITPAPLRAKLGVMYALRGNLRQIHTFQGRAAYHGDRVKKFRDGVEVVRNLLDEQNERTKREQENRNRLKEYAGIEGVDENGQRLDKREFAETKEFLIKLSFCHMGWYRNRGGRYRVELLDVLTEGTIFDRYNLPKDHGIVMKVHPDGQAWYAYRKTITGWVLGIGAKDKPSDQWFYEGPEPPTSFPEPGKGWGKHAHDRTTNWE